MTDSLLQVNLNLSAVCNWNFIKDKLCVLYVDLSLCLHQDVGKAGPDNLMLLVLRREYSSNIGSAP